MQTQMKNSKMLRMIVVTRVALAGALLCTVSVGALSALLGYGPTPAGVDAVAALFGGGAAGAAKFASILA